jgi:Domain of unknown function (DUF4190)
MSQMPPGGPPSYPPNYPPYVPPGMQGAGGYSMPPAGRTSGAAVTSLVCGLLMCIPFVAGLIAIITGIVGISTTGNPAVRGRGMAIAGLILGFLNLAGWGAGTYGGYEWFQRSAPDRTFANQYVADLVAGKTDQCMQNSTANIVQQQLDADYKQSQAWGTFRTAMAFPNSWKYDNGKSTVGLQGACGFSSGSHKYVIVVVSDGGAKKVDSFQWLP